MLLLALTAIALSFLLPSKLRRQLLGILLFVIFLRIRTMF